MRIALKFYSCVGSNHTTLDAIRNMQKRRHSAPDEIDSIVVHGSQVTVDHVGWPYRPQRADLGAAQSAVLRRHAAARRRRVRRPVHRRDCVADPARMALSRKVEVRHDPAITALGAAYRHKVRVDVHFADGSAETETREAPRGSEQSFASASDIVGKFRKLTRGVMASGQQDALIEAVMEIEHVADSRALTDLLRVCA